MEGRHKVYTKTGTQLQHLSNNTQGKLFNTIVCLTELGYLTKELHDASTFLKVSRFRTGICDSVQAGKIMKSGLLHLRTKELGQKKTPTKKHYWFGLSCCRPILILNIDISRAANQDQYRCQHYVRGFKNTNNHCSRSLVMSSCQGILSVECCSTNG